MEIYDSLATSITMIYKNPVWGSSFISISTDSLESIVCLCIHIFIRMVIVIVIVLLLYWYLLIIDLCQCAMLPTDTPTMQANQPTGKQITDGWVT